MASAILSESASISFTRTILQARMHPKVHESSMSKLKWTHYLHAERDRKLEEARKPQVRRQNDA